VKLSFVIPWFSADIRGGAESQCRHTAQALRAAGAEVEVLATCIQKHDSDWGLAYFPEGDDTVDGMTVRRFRADPCPDPRRFQRLNGQLVAANGDFASGRRRGAPLAAEDEAFLVSSMARSSALEDHIRQHRETRDFFLFLPYLFATSLRGAAAAGDRAILVPCLHNESYAYLGAVARMFRSARGILFNSGAEARLAERILGPLPHGRVVGEGVTFLQPGDPERFRQRYGIRGPYLLYLGRKHATKNVPDLVLDTMVAARELGGPITLVLAGEGRVDIPAGAPVTDVGFIQRDEKADALAGALALVNPSVNESFSLVVMESWLAGRPVLVNAACDVTAEHCRLSHGGLAYADTAEFVEAVGWLLAHPQEAAAFGRQGGSYVRQNYDWPVIAARYLDFLRVIPRLCPLARDCRSLARCSPLLCPP
jgi:glycosyltransferase involved in cell wall biosynthesis